MNSNCYRKNANDRDEDNMRRVIVVMLVLILMSVTGATLTAGAEMTFQQTKENAEQGDAKAQFNLGFMYFNGIGVPQDQAEAAKWYRKAAEQGYAKAQFNLGMMYANGEGVPQDRAEAAKWYRKAAEQGIERAKEALDTLFQ